MDTLALNLVKNTIQITFTRFTSCIPSPVQKISLKNVFGYLMKAQYRRQMWINKKNKPSKLHKVYSNDPVNCAVRVWVRTGNRGPERNTLMYVFSNTPPPVLTLFSQWKRNECKPIAQHNNFLFCAAEDSLLLETDKVRYMSAR